MHLASILKQYSLTLSKGANTGTAMLPEGCAAPQAGLGAPDRKKTSLNSAHYRKAPGSLINSRTIIGLKLRK